MTKSGWVSFCGWSCFGLVLFGVSAAMMGARNPHPPIPAAIAALSLLLAVPAFGLWLLGTVFHRFRVNGARIKAQALLEAAKASGRMGGSVPAITRRPVDPSASVVPPGCGVCGQPHAVVCCTHHGIVLCPQCWGVHHQEAVCKYVQIGAGQMGPEPVRAHG